MLAPVKKAPVERRIVRAACPHDCPDTCALEVTVEDGVAVKVEGAKGHPFTAGTLCTKVARYLERTYSKDRVLLPAQADWREGQGRVPAHFLDEALDTIAARFRAIDAEDPQGFSPTTTPAPWATCSATRWAGASSTASARRAWTHDLLSAGKAGAQITVGGRSAWTGALRRGAPHPHLGLEPDSSRTCTCWSRAQEAKRRGAKLIAIDPYRSLSAEKCHEHLALLPGSDAALALAMMNVIIGENRYDADYVAKYTLGFEQLRERVKDYRRRRWPRSRASCRKKIVAPRARSTRGTRPPRSGSTTGSSAMRAWHGRETIMCLPALTGDWRHPAGGAVLGTSDSSA